MYRTWYTGAVKEERPELLVLPIAAVRPDKRIPAIFFRTKAGREPVRDWLKGLGPDDRKRMGEDIKTIEFGWPVGMPVCRPMGGGLFEVRTRLNNNRVARVMFYVDVLGRMVRLHGFIKKTQATAKADLDLALHNMRQHKKGMP
jgi:phage-related protein